MIDKEKLHQILSTLWKNDDSVGKTYYNQALQDVQTSIDLQEKNVSEDLKTEINKYIKDHFTVDTEQLDRFGIEEKDYMYSMDKSDMLALVEHFINWHKTKEDEDLEEAMQHNAPNNGFITGSKWQKEQLIKNAIFGEWFRCGIVLPSEYYADDIKKVKLIIVKED